MARKGSRSTTRRGSKPLSIEPSKRPGSTRRRTSETKSKETTNIAGFEVPTTARALGGMLVDLANTTAGRVILAQVLIYAAQALSRNMPSGKQVSEAGTEAKKAVSGAARTTVKTTKRAAKSAKDLMMDIADVAVTAVGSQAVQAARNVIPAVLGGKGESGQKTGTPRGQRKSDSTSE